MRSSTKQNTISAENLRQLTGCLAYRGGTQLNIKCFKNETHITPHEFSIIVKT